MRLPAAARDALPNPVAGHATLDEVLSHYAERDPAGLALIDAGLTFPGTWSESDRVVSVLAETFSRWRLSPNAVVGVQLGSSFQGALTCLALWRAGMIAALLPLPWRRQEVTAALDSVGAEAMVTWAAAAGGRPGEAACEAAFSLDRLRCIATFGPGTPDGATPLDHLLDAPAAQAPPHPERPDDAADHVAVVTFDAGATPIARSHNELVAVGLAPLLAANLGGGDRLLSTLDLAGLAGLATGLVPWLVTRATATFHQASTTAALAAACAALKATHMAVPGRALERLAADGAFAGAEPVAAMAAWRAPDPRDARDFTGLAGATVVDVIALGELGLIAAVRSAASQPTPVPLGVFAPEGLDALIDIRVAADGRVSVRGPVCPGGVFASPEGAALTFDADGYAATGFTGVADDAAKRVTLDVQRRGVLQVGGVSVDQSAAENAFAAAGLFGALDTQDDATLGARVRLTLEPGADAISADDAAALVEAAGYGPALAPRTVTATPARKTA